jgi:hypothetical protein
MENGTKRFLHPSQAGVFNEDKKGKEAGDGANIAGLFLNCYEFMMNWVEMDK